MQSSLLLIVTTSTLYLGFGFLLSRFLRSRLRNLPITWLFLTVIFFPVTINTLTIFLPLSHVAAVLLSAACFPLGMLLSRRGAGKGAWAVEVLEEKHRVRGWELAAYAAVCAAFMIAVLLPKFALVMSGGPGVSDDYNNVRKVLAVSYDLDAPKYALRPTADFSYYYYDFILPGILGRTTSLSARAALLTHAVLEEIALLSFFVYIACYAFRKIQGRAYFLFCCTFLSGLEYFLYWYRQQTPPDSVEWWAGLFPFSAGLTYQLSAFYTLFLWVPQHLIGAVTYVLVVLLSLRPSRFNVVLIPLLFASILGFSTFVFVTAVLSYGLSSFALFWREKDKARCCKTYCLQGLLFLILSWKMIALFMGKEPLLSGQTLLFHFLPSPHQGSQVLNAAAGAVIQLVNYILTLGFFFAAEMGIAAVLAVVAFIRYRKEIVRGPASGTLLFHSLATVVASMALLSLVRSCNNNDLFMRGIIIVQFSIFFAGAILVDRMTLSWKRLLPVLPLLVAAQMTGMYVEYAGHAGWQKEEQPRLYTFIESSLPKDAVFFTGQGRCDDITYRAGRVCMNNADQIDRQYTKNIPLDGKDEHTLAQALQDAPARDAYFLADHAIQAPMLSQVYADGGDFLYAIAKPIDPSAPIPAPSAFTAQLTGQR